MSASRQWSQPAQLVDRAANGRRARPSRSASEAVPLSSDVMASPIGSRSFEKPRDQSLEPVDRTGNWSPSFGQRIQQCSQVVDQLLDDLAVVRQRI